MATAGNGNLWDWLLMMVLRFQLEARPDLRALSEGYDVWYNEALATRADVGPLLPAPGGGPTPGPPRPRSGPTASDRLGLRSRRLPATDLGPSGRPGRAARRADRGRHHRGGAPRHPGGSPATDARFAELGDRLDHLGERLEALIELEVSMAERFSALDNRLGRVMRPFRGDDRS